MMLVKMPILSNGRGTARREACASRA